MALDPEATVETYPTPVEVAARPKSYRRIGASLRASGLIPGPQGGEGTIVRDEGFLGSQAGTATNPGAQVTGGDPAGLTCESGRLCRKRRAAVSSHKVRTSRRSRAGAILTVRSAKTVPIRAGSTRTTRAESGRGRRSGSAPKLLPMDHAVAMVPAGSGARNVLSGMVSSCVLPSVSGAFRPVPSGLAVPAIPAARTGTSPFGGGGRWPGSAS